MALKPGQEAVGTNRHRVPNSTKKTGRPLPKDLDGEGLSQTSTHHKSTPSGNAVKKTGRADVHKTVQPNATVAKLVGGSTPSTEVVSANRVKKIG